MRKHLVVMMCIIMAVCLIPAVAMAEVTEETAVASVNGELCEDLNAVLTKVNDATGKVQIKLLNDIELPQPLTVSPNMDVELDLNGCKITAAVRGDDTSKHYYAVDNYGKLTISDSVGSGEIRARGIENLGNGTMTIDGGNFYSIDANGGACIWNKATLFVNGGNFKTIHVGSSSDNVGVGCLNNSGTATITAGNFDDVNKRTYAIISTGDIEITPAKGKTVSVTGAHGGLAIDSGVAVVNGGTYFSSEYYGLYVSNDGVGTDPMQAAVTVNDGSFDGANYSVWIGSDHNNPVNSTIEINGGKFNKPLNAQSCTREGAISIKGGTFSVDPSKYVATGYITTKQGDVWTVSETHKVAKIGDKKYETLAAAILDVPNGLENATTIKLIDDVDGGVKIGENGSKNIVIDLNGYTYDVKKSVGSTGTETNGMQLLKGSIVVIKNGIMESSTPSTRILIKNYANLTLENISIKGTENDVAVNNCGQLVINGEKTRISSPDGIWSITTGNYGHGDIITTEINAGTISSVACETPLWETGSATVEESVTTTIKGGNIGKVGEYDWRADFGGEYANAPMLTNWKMNIQGGIFNTQVESKYIVEGFNQYKKDDGKFVISSTSPSNSTGNNTWVLGEDGVYTEAYSTPYIPSTPPTPTDNVTNSGSTTTDNASTNADLSGNTSTSNGTTTATVDKTTADKIVDKAVENKSTEVVIDATANTTTAADSTTIAQVTIPTETLGAIAEKTEADVTIKTDVAEVKMDNAAATAVSEQATGDTVQIIAEKVAEETDKVEFELKVVCSDGKVISDFKGGNVAVTVALPKEMAEKKVVCVYIDDNGHMSKVEGKKNADGTYTFNTGHFSSYAILTEEEADAAIEAQKEAIRNIKIKLRSELVETKSGKKAVKVNWTVIEGNKKLDGVEIYRSTERFKGYGTKPFYTSAKGGKSGSYINTNSLKKGTRYYYKVRGYILVDGQKVYTDYSTKAWRTVR